MTERLNSNGMTIAPGVVDTIIAIAVEEVDGVASLGQNGGSSLRSAMFGKQMHSGIETQILEDGKLNITLHLDVKYGYVLPDLAAKVRQSVSDALSMQVGAEAANIDIYVDGISFDQQ
ncbi:MULTISPECIES: Asp23/Gls24 family envelope stress response protein [unclassified Adlercreutzia]|uniref:Asp23/Gls24 family envelope stress response protein n=1 Tax=unclassified Adlercreutzia TaxID=2636013 RepID=UPI0013EE3F22|nr:MULTISPECIES: Asp23/Gls24 family envelope stress response protein [unclassified Adlercreutzia]